MAIATDTIKAGKFDWFYREINREVIDKPPILFLHGLISHALQLDCNYGGSRRERIQVRSHPTGWVLDILRNQTTRQPRDFPYTPDAYIQSPPEFLNALQLTKFYLVVQGFLGSVGLQYALRHPEKIERLLILNTPVSGEGKITLENQTDGIAFYGYIRMTQDPLLVDRTLEGGSGYVIEDKERDVYRRPFLKSSSTGRALMATIKNLQLNWSMEEIVSGFPKWLHTIEMIWGTADPWLDLSMAESFALEEGRGNIG
ncbi:hypothetical protein [Arthrospira platensis]|uniref:AB hydrolase-1 domain-containing protein n=1 Tax=Limnospira platensis NIES-46 TaxID=1236695 RepID=A0A5M3TDY4_LIMPL|nr:hypothetical protein [Arthrospira platensis]AMW29860.1 hydrolase [Arthrospira platensis YZ]KDR54233.1 hydrolase [Arthrospira platensis str. Paraca]MDF2212122.1 hydrolase [Arthrospira platensis NCB002]MDT9313247.1 hydrolase [Limnospira sp. Paracas R14]WAK73801.1 hydrolase [Arthrospira sp. PCC 9108]BAI92350.1 hypothetical protein NIES39_L01890 [Arthrospira platensis NIES-39]